MLLRKKEPVSDVFTYKRAFAKKINACACEKTMHNTHGGHFMLWPYGEKLKNKGRNKPACHLQNLKTPWRLILYFQPFFCCHSLNYQVCTL